MREWETGILQKMLQPLWVFFLLWLVKKNERKWAKPCSARHIWSEDVRPHQSLPVQGDPFKTLFVSRLSYDVTERKLAREFEEFGPIKNIRLVHEKNSGQLYCSEAFLVKNLSTCQAILLNLSCFYPGIDVHWHDWLGKGLQVSLMEHAGRRMS